MTRIQRALADVQWRAWRQGLQVECDGDSLVLKAQGSNTPGGQSALCNEDGIGSLKMTLERDTPVRSVNHHQCGRGTAGAFLLCFLAMFTAYTIGTFYPETRGITGPLTILCVVLVILSACLLASGRTQHD